MFRWHPDTTQVSESITLKLLDLSQLYQSMDACNYAIKLINARHYAFDPITLISISLKYNIKDVFRYAFNRLISKHVNEFEDTDYDMLTFPVWKTLFRIKEQLDLHRCIMACEPPPLVHSECCQNNKRCLEDWHQVWWNGMGHCLLDGHNPQPYNSAVSQFESLSYGSMDPECWRAMVALVREGKAFQHKDDLIDCTARGLAEFLISEPVLDDETTLRSNNPKNYHTSRL